MIFNLVLPPAPQCIRPERIVGLPSTWSVLLAQGYFPCREVSCSSFTSWPKNKKKTPWCSMTEQCDPDCFKEPPLKWVEFVWNFVTLWWLMWENPVYFGLGSVSRNVLDCYNLYIFLTQGTHGTMFSLETNAKWVAKTTMLNSQEFLHNVHIYTTLQKGLGRLAALDHFTAHQRDLKWTFNYYCRFAMAIFLNMNIWLGLIFFNWWIEHLNL